MLKKGKAGENYKQILTKYTEFDENCINRITEAMNTLQIDIYSKVNNRDNNINKNDKDLDEFLNIFSKQLFNRLPPRMDGEKDFLKNSDDIKRAISWHLINNSKQFKKDKNLPLNIQSQSTKSNYQTLRKKPQKASIKLSKTRSLEASKRIEYDNSQKKSTHQTIQSIFPLHTTNSWNNIVHF